MAVIPWPLNPASIERPGAAPPRKAAAPPDDVAAAASTLIQSRQTILPKRLGTPGPAGDELEQILGAAAHAPDHGQLMPWRFVLVPAGARGSLADVFAQALLERDASATAEQVAQAREKAQRSPVLLLAVVDEKCGDPDIGVDERLVSMGCALQNMLLMATALGYGSALTSGKALGSTGLRTLFQLTNAERAVCFVSIGTVLARKPPRARPAANRYVGTLHPQCGVVPGF